MGAAAPQRAARAGSFSWSLGPASSGATLCHAHIVMVVIVFSILQGCGCDVFVRAAGPTCQQPSQAISALNGSAGAQSLISALLAFRQDLAFCEIAYGMGMGFWLRVSATALI